MATTNPPGFKSYAEFWPYYLSQHRKPLTRGLHLAGTLLALLSILWAIFSFQVEWLLAAPFIGYGVAWIAHAFIEKNHPATFEYPVWSLRGDLHMLALWLTGRLKSELLRYGIATQAI